MLLSHPWGGCNLSLIVERMTPPISNSFLPTLLNWWVDGFNDLPYSNKFGTLRPPTVTNDLVELFLTLSLGFTRLRVEVNVRQFIVNPVQDLVVHQL